MDYISINDFYKVCGYAFFYKADTVTEDEIPIEEITISLVSKGISPEDAPSFEGVLEMPGKKDGRRNLLRNRI